MCVHHEILGRDFLCCHNVDVKQDTVIVIDGPIPSRKEQKRIRKGYKSYPYFNNYTFKFVERDEKEQKQERDIDSFTISHAGLCKVQSKFIQMIVSEFEIPVVDVQKFYDLGIGSTFAAFRQGLERADVPKRPKDAPVVGELFVVELPRPPRAP